MNISMNITMRDAHLDEVTFLNETLSSWLNETVDISDEELKNWLTTVAEFEGEIVGFMGLEAQEKEDASQGVFAIDPAYRDTDVGKQVIKNLKGKLREVGIRQSTFYISGQDRELFLNCSAEQVDNIEATETDSGQHKHLMRFNLVRKLPTHSVEDTLSQLFCCKENIVTTKPKVLFLYGSKREGSYSSMLATEAARMMESFGAETRIFHPHEIPLADTGLTQNKDESALPESVIELRDAVSWSDAMVWISPEIHGAMSATFKNLIDWLPLSTDANRSTQGKVVALMQISGGSQSFNAVNQMRILGRWMRTYTIPNQSSLPTAYNQFHQDGTLKDSFYRNRVIDVLEELFRFTLLLRSSMPTLLTRWSETEQQDDDEPRPLITFQSAAKSLT